MTNARSLVPYDFRKASQADQSVEHLRRWLAAVAVVFPNCWMSASSQMVEFGVEDCFTSTFKNIIDSAPDGFICYEISVGDAEFASHVLLDRKTLRTFLECVVGEMGEEDSDARGLTNIERQLGTIFFEVFCDALNASWVGETPLNCKVGDFLKRPDLITLAAKISLVSAVDINIKTQTQSGTVRWILPRVTLDPIFENGNESLAQVDQAGIAGQVKGIPLDVVARLGAAHLTMKRLANVSEGDLLILDQKISNPISVDVAGQPHFHCWPGKVGTKQALQVIEIIPETNHDS